MAATRAPGEAPATIKQQDHRLVISSCLCLTLLLVSTGCPVGSQTATSQAQIESQIALTPRRATPGAPTVQAAKPANRDQQHSPSLLERLIISIDKLQQASKPDAGHHRLATSSATANPNSNNQDSQQAFDGNDHQVETDAAARAMDTLEATTSLAELPNATHRYSLTGAESTRQPAGSEEDEDALVSDSNNVRLTEAGASSNFQLRQRQQHQQQPRDVITCREAFSQCDRRQVCGPALRNFQEHCSDLVRNETQTGCSKMCLDAMVALRSTEESDALMKCDCEDDQLCIRSKQRTLAACKSQVDELVRDDTVVSCSTASLICGANQSCSGALGYYYANCQSLVSLRYCSPACNNSLSILYRQPNAFKLITCRCDRSEDSACHRYKTLTERYCLNGQPSNSGDPGKFANNSNETLDPELPNNDSYLITNEHYDEARDYEDEFKPLASASFGSNMEDESNNLDGFETSEDNRPTIIGPVGLSENFNKQQQRQSIQTKQQQSAKRKAGRRGKNSNTNHKTRESGTYNQEGKRSRHSRLLASTSSAGSHRLVTPSVLLNLSMFCTTAAAFIVNHQRSR